MTFTLTKAIVDNNLTEAKALHKEMVASESDPEKKFRLDAFYYFQLSTLGNDNSAIGHLQELTNNKIAARIAHHFIGLIYQQINQHDRAIEEFNKELGYCNKQKDKADAVGSINLSLYRIGRKQEALNALRKTISEFNDKDAQGILLAVLITIYELEKDYFSKAFAAERYLSIYSDSIYYRFEAAYAYTECGMPGMALLHYKTICQQQKDHAGALNNLGVAYDKLGLSFRAIKAYKLSAENKNSLAMANIAYKYINAGFKDEAAQNLKKANECDEIHPNVGEALTKLKKKEKDEDDSMEKYLQSAREKQSFFRDFGSVYEKDSPTGLNSDNVIFIDDKSYCFEPLSEGNKFKLVPIDKSSDTIQYMGNSRNLTITVSRFHVFKHSKDDQERIFEDSNKFLGIINENHSEIRILEYLDDNSKISNWVIKNSPKSENSK